MDAYSLMKFLHILTMFAAVGVIAITELLLKRATRTTDVAGLRAITSVIQPLAILIPVLFLTGIVLGVVTVVVGGLDFLRPWLVASYVLVVITVAVGAGVASPWGERVTKAAQQSPLDAPSPELQAAISDRRGTIASVFTVGSIVAIIFLMVVKPGG